MRLAAACLLLLDFDGSSRAADSASDDDYDIALLKQHGVKADADGLTAFFRDRTLDEAKIKRIRGLIRQMGDGRFAVRDRATKDLLAIGVPTLRFLDEATRDKDSEIALRAERLIVRIKSGPGPSLPIAALRQLRKHPSADATSALLGYLPFAEDGGVEEEALAALVGVGIRGGKPDASFRATARDPFAARRMAVGFVLGRSGVADDRRLAREILKDPDAAVRYRAAEGLIAGHDTAAVPALIGLLTTGGDDITWRAEEWLRRIAGDASPASLQDDMPETRREFAKKWLAWWEKNEKEVNLAKVPAEAPLLGLWLGIEYNTNSVWECGRDGKRRWTITAEGPMDAHVLPGNRVLIAEQNAKRVTERDLKGNILWQFDMDEEALNCRRLPNGNTFIGTRLNVMEVRPDKSVAFKHKLSENYMHAVRRMPNGHFVGVTSGGVIHEMDAAGKKVRSVAMVTEGTWGDVEVLPGGRYLVSNYGTGFVREVDAGGTTIREVKVPDACGVNRLPDGQLLVSGQGKAMIVDWTGKSTWDVKSDGCVRRIHRR